MRRLLQTLRTDYRRSVNPFCLPHCDEMDAALVDCLDGDLSSEFLDLSEVEQKSARRLRNHMKHELRQTDHFFAE